MDGSQVRISRKLNLVVPVDTDSGTYYVHSMPISREVFERYFLVLSKTFAAIYAEGLNYVSGPRVAMLMLRKIAEDSGTWEGPTGVQSGLIAEMRRLSNVVVPRLGGGWQTLPFQEVVSKKMLDPDDLSEVENAVCFFTVASAVHRRAALTPILDGMTQLWGAQTTLSSATELAASLPTSTEIVSSGETAPTSSVPS